MTHVLRRSFSCPVELAVEIVGGKWKVVILAQLKERPLRYKELRSRVPTLSEKMLVQRLRDLEQLGLIVRHKRGGRGALSRYELTSRGESLKPALQALHDWGESIAPEVGAIIMPVTPSMISKNARKPSTKQR
jgi:DNA-binding HxlR family transcriptional regulator